METCKNKLVNICVFFVNMERYTLLDYSQNGEIDDPKHETSQRVANYQKKKKLNKIGEIEFE